MVAQTAMWSIIDDEKPAMVPFPLFVYGHGSNNIKEGLMYLLCNG